MRRSEDETWCTRKKMKNYMDYCRACKNLKNTFNPVRFDPDKWATAAATAGMKVNRESIYKTRPIDPYKNGKTCFTSLPDGTIYVLYLADEKETGMHAFIDVRGFQPSKGSTIQLLGRTRLLKWETIGNDFRIKIPSPLQPPPGLRSTSMNNGNSALTPIS
jgi:hypothetical protein